MIIKVCQVFDAVKFGIDSVACWTDSASMEVSEGALSVNW